MDVVSAKTSFFEGITLSFCPCGYAQPPEGDKPSPLIELTPFPPLQRQRRWRGGKGYFIDFGIIEPIPWAEAHGYKGCVPPGRVPAS